MDEVTGKIENKVIKAYEWGNLVTLRVGTRVYSVFDNKLKGAHTKDLLHSLKTGDKVHINFDTTPNEKNPEKPFYNITGIELITDINDDLKDDLPEKREPRPPVQVAGRGDFPYSMKISYMKDLQIGFPQATERELLERVDLLRKMADRFGE